MASAPRPWLTEIAGRDEELTGEIRIPCILQAHEASAVSAAENMKNVYKPTAVRKITNALAETHEHQSNGAHG